jgi:hypothetical protein
MSSCLLVKNVAVLVVPKGKQGIDALAPTGRGMAFYEGGAPV